jgi:drug/metabolite transporter (DMT)-like permease
MTGDMGIDLLCCSIAGIGFGINFVPVKKLEIVDGVFFSFCMSLAIITVGVILSLALPTDSSGGVLPELPAFYPFAMLGGAVWMVGNLMCPIIIKWNGLGVSQMVLGITNMLVGWATGRFGLFHITKQTVISDPVLGLLLSVASLFVFTQVRDLPEDLQKLESEANASDTKNGTGANTHARDFQQRQTAQDVVFADVESRTTSSGSHEALEDGDAKKSEALEELKFGVGWVMAMLAGALAGFTFTPIELLAQAEGNDHNYLDYIWSSFAGIAVAGSVAVILYALVRGKKAHMPRAHVLPALASGAIWSVAQTAWFKANEELSMVIAFPIITSLPGILALAIGMVFFGELRTRRARVFAAIAVILRLAGTALITLDNMPI